MRAVVVCIIAVLLTISGPARAQVPKRVALVIGNEAYRSLTALSNPRLDAERLAALLDANGFDVIRCDSQHPGCFDLTRDGLEGALEILRKKASGADLALVFYAGHGMEGRDGNVLAPVDMEVIDCVERALRRGVPLDELFKAVSGARRKIVIIDACRDDPFAQCPPVRGSRRPMSFAPLTVPESESFMLVSSTKPGQVALDGPAGAHSPYARALLRWLEKEPAVYFHQVLSHTARDVIEDTSRANATQVPEMLVRGVAPDSCLKGEDCVGDVRAVAVLQELEALKQEHARDQELAEIARDYLSAAEKERARRPLTEEERKEELQRLREVSKGVSDFMLDAAKGRGRPFSREDEAQTLAGLMSAGRALLALNDTRAERALERLKANDETEAERLFDEVLAARKQAAATAQARAVEENKEAAKAARHLAAIAKPKNVAKAADVYKEAAELDPADTQTWIDYGRAARLAGRSAEAKAAFEQADAKARERNDVLAQHQAAVGLGDVAGAQSRDAEAERHYRAALALADPAAKADPTNPAWQRALSTAHDRVGYILSRQNNFPAASESLRAALAIAEPLARADPGNGELALDLATIHQSVGWVQSQRRDPAGALASYQAARDIAERFSKIEPNNGNWLSTLVLLHVSIAFIQQEQGDPAGALASGQTALAFGERMAKIDPSNARWQRVLAGPYLVTGLLQEKQGDNAGAFASYQAVQAVAKRLAQIDPGNPDPQSTLAMMHHAIGRVLFEQRDLAGALASFEEATGAYQRLLEADATNDNWQASLASVESSIGDALDARGDLPGALTSYRAAIVRYGKTNPRVAPWQGGLWATHGDVARILEKQGDMAGALASYRAMQSVAENQVKIDSGNANFQGMLALTHGIIGSRLQQQGDLAGSLSSYRAALAIDEELAKSDPGSSERLQRVASDHYSIGEVLGARDDLAGALTSHRTALAMYEEFARNVPNNTKWQRGLAFAHGAIAGVLYKQGDLAGALASIQVQLTILRRMDPANAAWLAEALGNAGAALRAQGDLAGALPHYREALAINERLAVAEPDNSQRQVTLAVTHGNIAGVLKAQGDLAGALVGYREALATTERLAASDPGNADWQRNLSFWHNRVGGVLLWQGDPDGALGHHRTALGIAERFTVIEPASTDWQWNLSWSRDHLARALYAKGDRSGALVLWRKALAVAETRAATIEREETGKAGKPGTRTAEALGSLSYYALYAREHRKALAAAERGHAIAPDLPWIDFNRATALLFLKRPQEAKVLYLAHKGKSTLNESWETVSAESFRDLRLGGLGHPMMRQVEAELGIAPAPAPARRSATTRRAGTRVPEAPRAAP